MGWLQEVIGDAQEYAAPKEIPDYIWDDIELLCAPLTYVYAPTGKPALGLVSYR